MGKKTDRIAELENKLEAAHTLIVSVANLLNIGDAGVRTDLDLDNVRSWIARFTQAIHARAEAPPTTMVAPAQPAARASGSWDTFDSEVDEEIDRMKSRDLVPRTPTEASSAMVASGDDDGGWPMIADIASVVGVDVSREASHGAALSTILRTLEALKNPGDVAGETAKGDSLLDAVRHGRDAEHQALGDLRGARESLARIASALQIPHWDPANPEAAILERVQHWDGLKHMIRRRISLLETGYTVALDAMEGKPTHIAVMQDLKWVLTQIIAPIPLAKFLGKMPAAVAATPTVMQAADVSLPSMLDIRPVTRDDVNIFTSGEDDHRYIISIMQRIAGTDLTVDLLNFLNLVVLPALRRRPSAG